MAGDLPTALPDPYIFGGGGTLDYFAAGNSGQWLLVMPGEGAPMKAQLQDSRQFKVDQYQLLLRFTGGQLEAGQPVKVSLMIDWTGDQQLAALRQFKEEKAMSRYPVVTSEGPLTLTGVNINTFTCKQYEKLELTCELGGTWDNPFDPEQVRLDARVKCPDGRELLVPGFFYQPYERALENGTQVLTKAGEAKWMVRFAPQQEGEYEISLEAVNQGQTMATEPLIVPVKGAAGPGFIYKSKRNPYYFEYETGEPYFAIGENVCWPQSGGTYDFDNWLPPLAENGGNYLRLWASGFSQFALEHNEPGRPDCGLGRYDQVRAWNTDYVLELCERLSIMAMYCIDSFNFLRKSPPYPAWNLNPYATEFGGMIDEPEQFFTNPDARKLYKQRLRYIVARWGYSPNIFSWEFWNEVDIIEKYLSADSVAWHDEMAKYLRSIDPWGHLITTSFAGTGGDDAVNALDTIEYTMAHNYNSPDMAAMISGWSRKYLSQFEKPFYFGEFGTDVDGQKEHLDKEGVYLHNGLWAGLACGNAGTAMTWWWDSYVHPKNMYPLFKPVAEFVKGLPLLDKEWRDLVFDTPVFIKAPEHPAPKRLLLNPQGVSWEPAPFNQPQTFDLGKEGKLTRPELLPRVLHGVRNHPNLHNPVTFEVDYTYPGTFAILVGGVSGYGGAGLEISLDGQLVLQKDFPQLSPDDHATITKYDGEYSIEVPAGKHSIKVENTGEDWFYTDFAFNEGFAQYSPNLRVLGRQAEDWAFGWVQNSGHTWQQVATYGDPPVVEPARFLLRGLEEGEYLIAFFDTYTGKPLSDQPAEVANGVLAIELPAIAKDLAFTARKR